MKLRIFLPAIDRPAADTRFAWKLFDTREAVLREGASPLAELPRASAVEAVLPAQRVLFARLRLPRVNAATIRELLPYAVEDRLLADPAHIHAVAGATNERGETVVAVVDRDWLATMIGALRRAGHVARSAWCESELARGARGEWHIAWSAGRGMLVDDEGVAATFDPSENVPLALRVALDEAAARGERPSALRIHPEGDARLPDLARWSSETGVPCQEGPPWEERLAHSPRAPLDLLQGELAPRSALSWRLPRQAAVLAAVIVALQLAFTAADAWRLQREYRQLDAQREALFRETFPEARVVVDPELQMARNLAELRRSRGLAGGDEFLLQLTRAARASAQPAKSVEFGNGKLTTR
ncbi:MAG TPA: type II secretion system protein GspL [Usitatibacter sp.]|nr:type II secretion system protein GspL [Usitatibacter sp.]